MVDGATMEEKYTLLHLFSDNNIFHLAENWIYSNFNIASKHES
jgi:hypothetical protein